MSKEEEQKVDEAIFHDRENDVMPPINDGVATSEQSARRKDRNAEIEQYRNTFLCRRDVTSRQPIYISKELHAGLSDIVKVIGGKHSSLGGYVENILRAHLSDRKELINSVHKTRYKAPVQW